MDTDDLHPISQILTMILATGTSMYGLVITWVAFVGGTVPLLGWEFQANLFRGLVFLFLVEPLIVTVGMWFAALVIIPIDWVLRQMGRN